ncbi:MAG TPA: hypothetical protein DCL48_04745 [Alphaproteobacteria bacterium]|nr:hypothetical protein [Alphaproteobacteria bacterium]
MTLSLVLPHALREAILVQAQASPREEICGLLIGDGLRVTALAPSPNIASEPEFGFAICDEIHARAQKTARLEGRAIIGCYHSHPSGEASPSQIDLLAIHEDGFVWMIATPTGALTAWRARQHGGVKRFEPLPLDLTRAV